MRSKELFRLLSAVILFSMMLTSFTGCKIGGKEESNDPGEVKLQIPAEIMEIIEGNEDKAVTPEIHFYFNNTADTKGFFSKKLLADEKGKYERGVYDENAEINTLSFVDAIKESFDEKYKTVEYSITHKKNEPGWEWTQNPSVYGECSEDDFFIGTDKNEKVYIEELIDSVTEDDGRSVISVYLTSLAELDNNMSDLSEWVNSKIKVTEDFSACVVCVLCDYNGKIYPNKSTSAVEGKEITGKRPLYLVMTGPTDALEEYSKILESSLKSEGFDGDTEYSISFFPESRPTAVKENVKEVVASPLYEYKGNLQPNQKDALFTDGKFNSNINLEKLDQTEYGDVLDGVDDYMDMYVFQYNPTVKEMNDRILLNLYVPLYDCSSSGGSDYDSYIYTDSDDTSKGVDIHYYYHDDLEPDGTATGDAAASEGALESSKLEYYKFDTMGFGITTNVIDGGDVPEYEFGTLPDKHEEVSIDTAVTLEADHKWLQITLEYRFDPSSVTDTSSVMLNIPVYAIMKSAIPAWVNNCNCEPEDYDPTNADALAKTCNLLEFVNKVTGGNGMSEESYRMQYEEKIADVVVCIHDIPVAG